MFFKTFMPYWSGLRQRERIVLGGGLICLFLLLLTHFILLPFFEARDKMTRSIARQEKVLQELTELKAQYQSLKGGTDVLRQVMERRSPDFTMASHLDRIINETDMKSCIQDFQSTKSQAGEGYDLTRTEIKIARVTMDQLIQFLYLAESPEYGIWIEQISIAGGPAETGFLSATLALKTYEKTSSI